MVLKFTPELKNAVSLEAGLRMNPLFLISPGSIHYDPASQIPVSTTSRA
jgi:hypothetical protein